VKTLIIGGSSFVGKNFTRKFMEDSLSSSRDKNTRLYLDLENVNSCFFEEIKKERIEYCFFLAAISSPDDCQEKYEKAKLINYTSTKKVIGELLKMSVKVIFFSSDQVYSDLPEVFNRHSECNPKSKYGILKKKIEDSYIDQNNFKIFRLSYIYDSKDSFLRYLKESANLNREAKIFKNFERNIVFIDDVVDCMHNAVSNWEQIKKITNICGPTTFSREKMAEIVQKKTYNNLKYSVIEPDKSFWESRTKICRLDPSETAEVLGRSPITFEDFLDNHYEQ